MRWLFLVLTAAGIALRLWQYAGGASMWGDELAVARNVVDRPLGRLLFEPLDYDQIAPPGFLLAEKLAVSALGPSDYALRLFPFLCGVAAVLLFRRVAENLLLPGAAALALALFALGIPFISYGAQVKQYSSDAAVGVLLFLLALKLRDAASTRYRLVIGAAGAVAAFFSHAAVLVLAGLGAGLAAGALMDRDWRLLRLLLPTVVLWAVGSTAAAAEGLYNVSAETRMYVERFWRAGFMPLPPRSASEGLWIWQQLNEVFGRQGLRYPWPAAYVGLAVVGVVSIWRRRREVALLLLAPVVATLAASAVHLYPFRGRLIVFLLPLFLLAVAEGVGRIARLFPARWSHAGAAVLAAAIIPAALAIRERPPVYRIEETRPAFAYLQTYRQPGDALYVYYGAWQAVSFYGPKYGLVPGEYLIGGCHRGKTRRYLQEIDRFRGRPRVWVMFSHALAIPGERKEIVRYLGTIGRRIETSSILPTGSPKANSQVYLYLYDLSDSARLESTTAEAFSIAQVRVDEIARGCRYGPYVPPRPGS